MISDCTLALLHPLVIPDAWPKIEPFLLEACKTSKGRYTADDIKGWAERGDWQIWVVSDEDEVLSVTGTQIITYDTGLQTLAIRLCDGRERQRWQHYLEDILDWGKQQGCTKAEGTFRIGWRRVLPGWEHTHEFMERAL